MADSLERLRGAGLDTDALPEAQRQVLSELSRDEVDLMIKIRERMRDAGEGEVQGYAASAGDDTGVFYY